MSSGCSGIGIDTNTLKNSIKLQVPITKAPMVYATQTPVGYQVNKSIQNETITITPTPTKSRFVYV